MAHAQSSFVEDDLKAVEDKMVEADGLATAHNYTGACDRLAEGLAICDPLSGFLGRVTKMVAFMAKVQTQITSEFGTWTADQMRVAGAEKVEIETKFGLAESRLAAEKTKLSEHDLNGTDTLLRAISKLRVTIGKNFSAYKIYVNRRGWLRNKIAKLKKHPGHIAIKPELVIIDARFAAAEAKAAETPADCKSANALMDETKVLCESAEKKADKIRVYLKNRPFIIRDYEYLKDHPQKAAIQAKLDEIARLYARLKTKETASEYEDADSLLKQMAPKVRTGFAAADRLVYPSAKTKAAASIETLKKHKHADGITGEIGPIDLKFAKAEKLFPRYVKRAMEMINEVELFCKHATTIARSA